MSDLRKAVFVLFSISILLSCAGDQGGENRARDGLAERDASGTAAGDSTIGPEAGARTPGRGTGVLGESTQVPGSGDPIDGRTVVKPPAAVPETLRIDPGTGDIRGSDAATDSLPATGRWRKSRDKPSHRKLTPEQEEQIRKLESIGYVSGSRPARVAVGVTEYDSSRAYEGLNFYVSGHAPEALLMDMNGVVLHSWSYDFSKIWPGVEYPAEALGQYHWRRAYLYENGDILAIHEGIGLIKLDKSSNLLWEYDGNCHHDLEVVENGDIYVLAREGRILPHINETEPVLEDFIVQLGSDGTELRRVSILKSMESSDYRHLLEHMPKKGDIFHTNTLEVLDGRLSGKSPAFRPGNVLISILRINTIAVIDLEAGKAVWAFRGRWRRQHQPTALESGTILLFNNGGSKAINSQVLEFDPSTREIPWSFSGTHANRFYSETCGSCQRLPNGNTLLTESDNGRALEITPDKAVVWEFLSPHRAGEDGEYVATLFEVIRLDPDFPLDWLPEAHRRGSLGPPAHSLN